MRPMTNAKRCAAALCALLWLSGCVSRAPLPDVETVTETVPVMVGVPDARTVPITLRPYPPGPLTCDMLEAEVLYLEGVVGKANADRAWIRQREGKVIEGGKDE